MGNGVPPSLGKLKFSRTGDSGHGSDIATALLPPMTKAVPPGQDFTQLRRLIQNGGRRSQVRDCASQIATASLPPVQCPQRQYTQVQRLIQNGGSGRVDSHIICRRNRLTALPQAVPPATVYPGSTLDSKQGTAVTGLGEPVTALSPPVLKAVPPATSILIPTA